MSAEYKKREDQAKRPWPTKAVLSHFDPIYHDSEGRRYYNTKEVKVGEEFVADRLESYGLKTHQALWCRLPPKTTSGGMPEEHTKLVLTRNDKVQVRVEVVETSTVKYSRERGTGFVVIKLL